MNMKITNEVSHSQWFIDDMVAKMSLRAIEIYNREIAHVPSSVAMARAFSDVLKEFVVPVGAFMEVSRDVPEKVLRDKQWLAHQEKLMFSYIASQIEESGLFVQSKHGFPWLQRIELKTAILRISTNRTPQHLEVKYNDTDR